MHSSKMLQEEFVSIIYWLNKYFLRTYHILISVLGTWRTVGLNHPHPTMYTHTHTHTHTHTADSGFINIRVQDFSVSCLVVSDFLWPHGL